MENQQRIQYANQAIMLDLSLFVLDILDADKIKQKPENSDHILEVPGALTLMMRDAESGSPILFLFIYSLLKKLRKKYADSVVSDQRLITIANARQDYQIREIALTATKRLFKEFAPLIENESNQIKTIDDFSLDIQLGFKL
jgi:hypothetical protein